MITSFYKSLCRHRTCLESYEDKCERRQEKREKLRRRNNMTTCRLLSKNHSKETKEPIQSPRQKEFLRRRNLITEEPEKKETKLLSGPKASAFSEIRKGVCGGISSQTSLPSSQLSWTTHTSQLQPSSGFSNSFAHGNLNSWGIFPKNRFTIKAPKSCKGTQTAMKTSAEKKSSSQQTDCGIAVLDKEIIQLSNYLKEALHRELLLKQKMAILQELLATLLQAAEKSWKGQLKEDKLKGRMSVLENQLQTCTQSFSKRGLKRILLEMEDQKQNYEQKAKESLQKLLEEKLQAEKQFQNAQRALAVVEEDCTLWKEHCNMLKNDWSQLTDRHTELENKLHVLENKLQWSDAQNTQLHQALQNLESERASLYSRIDILQVDSSLTMERLSAFEVKLQTAERQKLMLETTIKHLYNVLQKQSMELKAQQDEMQKTDGSITMQGQFPRPARNKQNDGSEDHKKERDSSFHDHLQIRTSQLTAKEKECADLRGELEILSNEYRSCQTKLQKCRDELKHSRSSQAQRRHGHWIPVLMVVMVTAAVVYLANFIP